MSDDSWAIGVDLGGTKVEVAKVDGEGKIIEKFRFPTDVGSGSAGIEKAIVEGVKRFGPGAVGVGVGVAGQVERGTGTVHFAPNLGWHEVPFQDDLHRMLGLPVIVTNDVRAGTWGEWLFGAGKGCDDLVCLFLGTGVGGGIVSEGKMVYGTSSTAGELGHMVVEMDGPKCTCGGHGCMEAFAGGAAMAAHAQELAKAHPDRAEKLLELADHQIEAITTRLLVDAFRAGDPLATEVLQRATKALIAGATTIVNGMNPSRIILGGGIIEGLPELVDWVAEGVQAQALKAAQSHLRILPARFGNDANVIGAAALALRAHD